MSVLDVLLVPFLIAGAALIALLGFAVSRLVDAVVAGGRLVWARYDLTPAGAWCAAACALDVLRPSTRKAAGVRRASGLRSSLESENLHDQYSTAA